MFSVVYAIHAGYATAVVNVMVLVVDTCGFALTGTKAAILAFGSIDYRMK